MYAGAHASVNVQTRKEKKKKNPHTPSVDLIEYRIKTRLFFFKLVSLRQHILHHKEGGYTDRKEKLN